MSLLVATALILLPVTAAAQSGMIRCKVRANNGVTVSYLKVEPNAENVAALKERIAGLRAGK